MPLIGRFSHKKRPMSHSNALIGRFLNKKRPHQGHRPLLRFHQPRAWPPADGRDAPFRRLLTQVKRIGLSAHPKEHRRFHPRGLLSPVVGDLTANVDAVPSALFKRSEPSTYSINPALEMRSDGGSCEFGGSRCQAAPRQRSQIDRIILCLEFFLLP